MEKWLDNYNESKVTTGPGFVGQGYDTTGRNYSPAWGGQFQHGGILGKTFLQPNDPKLPEGWNPEAKGYSTEYSTTIGKDGEYYLVPGFKHGKLVSDPEKEFHSTGELLGGPFKTIQSAQDFADRRHKYVEQGKPLPSPMKTYDYLKFAMGGSIPGAVGFTYARTQDPAPSNGKYAKKTLASAQNGKKVKEDSNLENIAEIFDPTGISSWDDIYRSYKETGMSPQTGLEIFGALPMLGKVGKLGKAAEMAAKAFAVTGRQKRNAKAVSETLKAIGKYGPSAGRATDAYQAAEQWQNGGEMKYYQEGLDWKPKSISKNGSVIKDDRGQWAHPGEITEIGSNQITMKGVDYPVLGISDTGDTKLMQPEKDYKFDGDSVTEYPMAQNGIITNDPKDPRIKAYQDSLNLYNKNKRIYESGIETKAKGLKYENVTKGRPYGERQYLQEGTAFDIVKKPKQPVKYQEAPKPIAKTIKGTKKFFINEDEVSEDVFNKIAPVKNKSGGWLNKYK